MAKKKETVPSKKEMVAAGKSFSEIEEVYSSVTKKELKAIAYELSMKTGELVKIEGLESGVYVNRKGTLVIGEDIIADLGFFSADYFEVSGDKEKIVLTHKGKTQLPAKKVKKKSEETTE